MGWHDDPTNRHVVANAQRAIDAARARDGLDRSIRLFHLGELASVAVAGQQRPAAAPPEPATGAPRLRIHGGLFLAASRRRLDRFYRLWVVLRAMDPDGCDWLPVRDVADFIARHKLRGLGNLRRLLADPQAAAFWSVHSDRAGRRFVRYASFERLGCELADGNDAFTHSFYVSLPEAASLKRFRAACYAGTLPDIPDGGVAAVPRSRAFLCQQTGRTRPTLRAWEALQRVRRVKNHAIYRDNLTLEQATAIAHEGGPAYFVLPAKRGYSVALSMPNSYEKTKLTERAAIGQARSLRRRHKPALQTAGNGAKRLYHFDAAKLAGRPARYDRYLFDAALYGGRVCQWAIVDGVMT